MPAALRIYRITRSLKPAIWTVRVSGKQSDTTCAIRRIVCGGTPRVARVFRNMLPAFGQVRVKRRRPTLRQPWIKRAASRIARILGHVSARRITRIRCLSAFRISRIKRASALRRIRIGCMSAPWIKRVERHLTLRPPGIKRTAFRIARINRERLCISTLRITRIGCSSTCGIRRIKCSPALRRIRI